MVAGTIFLVGILVGAAAGPLVRAALGVLVRPAPPASAPFDPESEWEDVEEELLARNA